MPLSFDRRIWRPATAFLIAMVLLGVSRARADFVLSDFNGSGFQWTWGGFQQAVGPSSLRLYDPIDGWGGAGRSEPGTWDLSGYSNNYLTVDLSANAGNGVDWFEVELYDRGIDGVPGNDDDRSGKWKFLGNHAPGVPQHLVAATNLANPDHGVGDWQNLNLSQIDRWQIIGDYGSLNPFDLTFDHLAVSSTEIPAPYAGWEPNAPWRADAAARIDAIRKGDMQISVTDAAGHPLRGAEVAVRMQKHAFGFGSAVKASRLRDSNPAHDAYKQKVAELFNETTIENNLKWEPWVGEWGNNFTQQGAVDAISWLANQGIRVRGHNLVWPGFDNLPQHVQALIANPPLDATEQQALRDEIIDRIAETAGYPGIVGALADWDVINEPRANHDVMDVLDEGDLAMAHWFQAAAAADPNAQLYLNEYNILTSGGGTNTSSQQQYFDTLEYLINNGAPIDGVGMQGHFSPGNATGPEQLWQIFDRFDDLDLDIKVTEFDFNSTDEELQADYMRDFMTAAFAHDALDAFIMWGFWEDAHWRPDSAMFRSDWSIKPNGEEYLDLVFNQWWTDEDLLTDALGEAMLRGFKGDYQITVIYGGVEQVFTVTLNDSGLVFHLALDHAFASDFDRDGDVDGDDFLVWQTNFGSGIGGDADGDGDTDGDDFLIWQSQFGSSAGQGRASVSAPEPATVLLLLFGGSLLFTRVRFSQVMG